MLNTGLKTKSVIVSLAALMLVSVQALISPAIYLNAVEESTISSPVSTPISTPTEIPTTPPTSGGNDNGGGNNGGGSSGGSGGSNGGCGEPKPFSAPTLYSVVNSGPNQATLRWLKATGPVTYYAVTYGTISGKQQYGNPHVGDANTTTYTVKNLSAGATYYFRVRAGNGCMPGDFSKEYSNRPTGAIKQGPATNFQPGILGTSKSATVKPVVTPAPTQ